MLNKSNSNLFLSVVCAISVLANPHFGLKALFAAGSLALWIKSEEQLSIVKDNPQRKIFESALLGKTYDR